jgi:uncharacterized membrane protein YtjA (UPF0391 family)
MFRWTVISLAVAIVAAFFGFAGIDNVPTGLAQVVFFVAAVVFLGTLVLGLVKGRAQKV